MSMSGVQLDITHAPQRRSWGASAHLDATDFPIQNLPFGRFREPGQARWTLGVAIGDQVLQSHFRDAAYRTVSQLIAHHTSNGCNLLVGDLLGTGTQSGPNPDQGGCLLALSAGGRCAVNLPNGEKRTFLEDGDRVILRGHCEQAGRRRIGFGDCEGLVLAAHA